MIINNYKSKYATLDSDATYLKQNVEKSKYRSAFFHDIDKILYSKAYLRYANKTQVFPYNNTDYIQNRMIHVQYVSKIARTIGRALGLNEDLIEAASLGHDLGHTPFGHFGESILNKISNKLNEGNFLHNVHSVRVLKDIENNGNGLNISVQVLDAILCHNGEIAQNKYCYVKKDNDTFLNEYKLIYKDKSIDKTLKPMTLEGCVVRISDIIAYLGRDIEDAEAKGITSFKNIPNNITSILGNTNRDIINTIVCDIIENSQDKPYIKLSDNIYKMIDLLKDYNYENIYYLSLSKEEAKHIETMFNKVIDIFIKDLNNKNYDSIIYKNYLNHMCQKYKENTNARIVIDFVAGMTDNYLTWVYESIKDKN